MTWGLRKILSLIVLAIAYCGVLFALSQASLTYFPNTGDENSILFQAKIFSQRMIAAPAPPVSELFASDYIGFAGGRWFSAYPPGHALLLVGGEWLGYPLLASFLMSFAIAWLLFRFIFISYGNRELAWVSTALYVLSPTFLFHSISYYTHVGAALVFIAVLNVLQEREPTLGKSILLAALLGFGTLIRPFTFFLLCFPLGAYMLKSFPKGRRRYLLLPIGGVVSGFSLFWAYETYLSGSLRAVPYLNAGGNAQKFLNYSTDAIPRIVNMLSDTVKWTLPFGIFRSGNLKTASGGDIALYAIPVGFAVLAFFGRRHSDKPRFRSTDYLLIACFVALVVGHLFYGAQGGRFGERYFFEAVFVLPILVARALVDLKDRLGRSSLKIAGIVNGLLMALLLLPGVLIYIPGTIAFFRQSNLRRMDIFLQSKKLGLKDALIFVRDVPEFDPNFYTRNEPLLNGNIYVRSGNPRAEAELSQTFPAREKFEYVKRGDHFALTK